MKDLRAAQQVNEEQAARIARLRRVMSNFVERDAYCRKHQPRTKIQLSEFDEGSADLLGALEPGDREYTPSPTAESSQDSHSSSYTAHNFSMSRVHDEASVKVERAEWRFGDRLYFGSFEGTDEIGDEMRRKRQISCTYNHMSRQHYRRH